MDTYRVEKYLWDDKDFDVLGWHDANIWAFHPNSDAFEFLVDLDYIFKWVEPGPGETYFKFWVAPVTMVFNNAFDIQIELNSSHGIIEVANLHRENPTPSPDGECIRHTFRFECQEGEIKLNSSGFTMFVRADPILIESQSLDLLQRGGVKFDRRTPSA